MNLLQAGEFNKSSFNSTARGNVAFSAYLPPCWQASSKKEYPLLIFLHGKGGDESTVEKTIKAKQLNNWILNKSIQPFVLIAPSGGSKDANMQWISDVNEKMISREKGELLEFCRSFLKAGSSHTSIEGHSRGAAGAIFFILKYPEIFRSSMACGYVSNYTLNDIKIIALKNKLLSKRNIKLKIEIGSNDEYLLEKNRNCSADLHLFLNQNNIFSEFELLKGVQHNFSSFWNFSKDKTLNGLLHIQFHQKAIAVKTLKS